MKIGRMKVSLIALNEGRRRLWIDAKIGRIWYVLQWMKGTRPFLYRSTDATPPDSSHENEGRMLFGRYTD